MKKLLIITDLDSSLLNEDYTYEEAKPVIKSLLEKKIPLILNSSKTIGELVSLSTELGLTSPIIAENGGIIAFNKNNSFGVESELSYKNYSLIHSGTTRDTVLECVHKVREEYNLKFKGFYDYSAEELSELTNLTLKGAIEAKERHVTEPILWHDTEDNFDTFVKTLYKNNIKVMRGGRFYHLMGQVDKANGVDMLKSIYKKYDPESDWVVSCIGDSENDLAMLNIADYPIVIPNKGTIRITPSPSTTRYASKNASAGWAEQVSQLIQTF